jgi:hypothetical protein
VIEDSLVRINKYQINKYQTLAAGGRDGRMAAKEVYS